MPPVFHERLRVPAWWHLVAVAVGVLIGAECAVVFPRGVVGQGSAVLVCVSIFEVGLVLQGRTVVEVADGFVRAGDVRLSTAAVRRGAVVPAADVPRLQRAQRAGVHWCVRGWVPSAVLLDVDDPGDAGRWVVSTRRPHDLLAALGLHTETPR